MKYQDVALNVACIMNLIGTHRGVASIMGMANQSLDSDTKELPQVS